MLSDDKKEYYRNMYAYGPRLSRTLAELARCLYVFYQAEISGNDMEITINTVVPKISGWVAHRNKNWSKAVYEFDDPEDLEIVLKRFVDEEKYYAEG